MYHKPALFFEVLDALEIVEDGIYVDLTFGGGGHSKGILERLGEKGRLYVFDQDPDAEQNLPDDPRIVFIPQNFRFLKSYLRMHGVRKVDGILADLGVSFHQFDTPERGFSFRFDAPLDMRMTQEGESALEWIKSKEPGEINDVFKKYGDLKKTYRFSENLKSKSLSGDIKTTGDVVSLIESSFPGNLHKKIKTLVFQSLRMVVNHEMDALEEMLIQCGEVLNEGGVLAVISYHSIEDRLVKNYMKSGNLAGTVEKDFFGVEHTPFTRLTRKPLSPSEEEIEDNPRARSAKLRVVKKK